MDYQKYIKTELLILIPVLYFIGIGLKKSKISDKFIPLLLGIASIALSAIWTFATSEIVSPKDHSISGIHINNAGRSFSGHKRICKSTIYSSKKDRIKTNMISKDEYVIKAYEDSYYFDIINELIK